MGIDRNNRSERNQSANTPGAKRAVDEPRPNQCVASKYSANLEPSALSAFWWYQDLLQKRLGSSLIELFSQLTGLHLHALWHRPLDAGTSHGMPIVCPMAQQRAIDRVPSPSCCDFCLQRLWNAAVFSTNNGRRFIGQCGITNFCDSLHVNNMFPLTLILQARVARRSSSPQTPRTQQNLLPRHNAKPIALAEFRRAEDLARLIVHDLRSTLQALGAVSESGGGPQRLNITEDRLENLRAKLRRCMPAIPKSASNAPSQTRAQAVIAAMIEYVRQNNSRPMNLGELALAMDMNVSYLSALFRQTTGEHFHHFLQEVRLSRAKELLRDPCNRIGTIAAAAGYASLDAFRHAFKAHEGVSPGAWRAAQ